MYVRSAPVVHVEGIEVLTLDDGRTSVIHRPCASVKTTRCKWCRPLCVCMYMSISPVSAHQLTIGKCRHSQTCRYVDLVIAMTLHNVCRCQLTMLTTSTNYTIQSLTPCAWVIDRSPCDVIVNFVVQVCIGCNNGIPKSSEVCLQGQRIFKSYRVSS